MSNNIILNNRYSYDPNPKNRLGKGAFGFVFRGIDLQTNEEIAIKFLQIDMLQDEYLKKALQRELQIQKLCECKYSTRLIDNFVHENFIYLILELCDGDLENELQRNGPFDVNKLRTVLTQLNQVFYIMYQRKIIHRDIKLANILIKYTNPQKTQFDVKLADFGFSTVSQENIVISTVGTPITSAPEVLEGQPYSNKADLWSIGIITYQLHFGTVPFFSKIRRILLLQMKNNKPEYTPKDPLLADLINCLLKPQEQDRISWENYFQHPFFGNNKIELNSLTLRTENAPYNGVYQNIKPQQKYVFINHKKYHTLSTSNYICTQVTDRNSNKNYIIKQYQKQFITKHKAEFEKEKELFQKMNQYKISSLIYVGEMETQNVVTLIFEYMKGIVLNDYIQQRQLNEIKLYYLIKTCITNIFEPMSKLGINLRLISLDSIAINLNENCATLFDCGFIRQIYSPEQINEYFIYPEEINSQNEKTNVLNFGVTFFKAFFKYNPFISPQLKDICLPKGAKYSNELKQFLGLSLYRNIEKRASFKILADTHYLTLPFSDGSENNSLFSIEMLEHLSASFTKKVDVIKCFIKSTLNQQLPKELIPYTSLFIFSVIVDIFFATKLFNDFLDNKTNINSVIHVIKIHPNELNILFECLDFKKIPLNCRYCSNESLDTIKILLKTLENLKKEAFKIFSSQMKEFGKIFVTLQMNELLKTTLEQFKNNNFQQFIDKIYVPVKNDNQLLKNIGLFVKYLLEYTITLYEINIDKPKIYMDRFYDFNEIYKDFNKEQSIEISTIIKPINLSKNKNIWHSMVFTSFLKNGFNQFEGDKIFEELIKKNNELNDSYEIFVEYYNNFIELLGK